MRAGGRLDAVCVALERVLVEQNEAQRALSDARRLFEFDPKDLEQSEERLFALRGGGAEIQMHGGSVGREARSL